MDLQFHGANCITIATKRAKITVDDTLEGLGQKPVAKAGDILLYTTAHGDPPVEAALTVDQPGEYEIAGISIFGIAARSHLEEEAGRSATMYKIMSDDTSILIVGHVFPELSDNQLEAIGTVDIMFIPVGGNGYTLDPIGALKIIKKIEPKLVIPTHFDSKKLHFPVPQQSLEQALKGLAMEPKDTLAKFRPKPEDLAEGITRLVVLEET
jgi:L-ascorbate metabolism protein UlaG (beta-lactamase superfamily)